MITTAHFKSRDSIIDPAYSPETMTPPSVWSSEPFRWLYGASEYECFLLRRMRDMTAAAKLRVGYPGEYHEASRTAFFRTRFSGGTIGFRACGEVRVRLGGVPVYESRDTAETHSFSCEAGMLMFELSAYDLPALLPFFPAEWEFSDDSAAYGPVETVPQTVSGEVPHRLELPEVKVVPRMTGNNFYDAGKELFGYVEIHTGLRPQLFVGETVAEAQNEDERFFEQANDLCLAEPGVWRSSVPLAFRYIKVKNAPDVEVVCWGIFTPEVYRGAFACPDTELNDIWMRSAYTLRLCVHHFLIDGIKRDRLPWVGDLRISMLANAFTFADRDVVRRTLAVLGRAGIRKEHLNGILDYSLWYIINHDSYQRYFSDPDFLRQEYARITDVLDVLKSQEDAEGFLPVRGWVFIDWVEMEKQTVLQILYYWALNSGAALAERMGDVEREKLWRSHASVLKTKIFKVFFDSEAGLFFSAAGEGKTYHRHENFTAILAGLTTEKQAEKIASELAKNILPPVGTPYMSAMEALAMGFAGKAADALSRIREIWGGMLKLGATAFYEAFDPAAPEESRYSFYGRKFGLSCCHAWGAGPASVLPMLLFGIHPLADGWKSFAVAPVPLFCEMHAAVPTPYGEIVLDYAEGVLNVRHPNECKCVPAETPGVKIVC